MRKLILLFAVILMTGCITYYESGEWETRLKYKDAELVYKNGLAYHYGKPFTGVAYTEQENGRLKEEFKFKDGKKDGVWEWYNFDGRLLKKEFWKNGELTKTMEF
ncbi:hypothetical protein JYT76_03755 [Olleya sp. AH-315-F22]|nr:hypothetical protein [Olleya sp. AH-315-F22]